MKAGWKTTEFWLTLAKLVLAVLVATGIIRPGDADTIGGQIVNAASAMAALIASGIAVAHYSGSRAKVKETAQIAAAHASRK